MEMREVLSTLNNTKEGGVITVDIPFSSEPPLYPLYFCMALMHPSGQDLVENEAVGKLLGADSPLQDLFHRLDTWQLRNIWLAKETYVRLFHEIDRVLAQQESSEMNKYRRFQPTLKFIAVGANPKEIGGNSNSPISVDCHKEIGSTYRFVKTSIPEVKKGHQYSQTWKRAKSNFNKNAVHSHSLLNSNHQIRESQKTVGVGVFQKASITTNSFVRNFRLCKK